MAENDRPNLNVVVKDGKITASPPSGKFRKVFGIRALGIKDEGGPRRGDLSCALDTIEALKAANMPVSMVGIGLEGKGQVSWGEGEIPLIGSNLVEETREEDNVIAAFNTVDLTLIPNQHLLGNGFQDSQALVEISKALARSNVQATGQVISAALVIGEARPAPTQTLPEVKPLVGDPVGDPAQLSNIIKIGEWTTLESDKKAS